jgi:hypothetical protein
MYIKPQLVLLVYKKSNQGMRISGKGKEKEKNPKRKRKGKMKEQGSSGSK